MPSINICEITPSSECMLYEEGDLLCIVHCSILSTEHWVLLPTFLKDLSTLSSAYFLVPFLFTNIEIFEFLELSSLHFSSLDFCTFSLIWLTPTYTLSSMWGQHYYLYVLVVALPKDSKLKCHCQLIYTKLLFLFVFIFYLKIF